MWARASSDRRAPPPGPLPREGEIGQEARGTLSCRKASPGPPGKRRCGMKNAECRFPDLPAATGTRCHSARRPWRVWAAGPLSLSPPSLGQGAGGWGNRRGDLIRPAQVRGSHAKEHVRRPPFPEGEGEPPQRWMRSSFKWQRRHSGPLNGRCGPQARSLHTSNQTIAIAEGDPKGPGAIGKPLVGPQAEIPCLRDGHDEKGSHHAGAGNIIPMTGSLHPYDRRRRVNRRGPPFINRIAADTGS